MIGLKTALLALLLINCEQASAAQRPHMVVLIGDDHSQVDSSVYGAKDIPMPNLERLAAEGATTFVEVGPGRVLTGLVKRIVPDATALSVEDPDGLEKALEALAKA